MPRPIYFGLFTLVSQVANQTAPTRFDGLGVALEPRTALVDLVKELQARGHSIAVIGDGDLKYTKWAVEHAGFNFAAPVTIAALYDPNSLNRLKESYGTLPSALRPILVDTSWRSDPQAFARFAASVKLSRLELPISNYVCVGAALPALGADADRESRNYVQAVNRLTSVLEAPAPLGKALPAKPNHPLSSNVSTAEIGIR